MDRPNQLTILQFQRFHKAAQSGKALEQAGGEI